MKYTIILLLFSCALWGQKKDSVYKYVIDSSYYHNRALHRHSYIIKSFGQQILDGEVKPAADDKTFKELDSLFCKNKAHKDFHFKVANKIQGLSDGALGEYVATIASEYYLNNILDFIKETKSISKEDINKWLNLVAYDLYADSKNGTKDLPNIKARLQELIDKQRNLTPNEKQIIKKHNDYIYIKTEELIKAG